MRRWTWNIFCALSLLIFATSVTLWVRSHYVTDVIQWGTATFEGDGEDVVTIASYYTIGCYAGTAVLYRDYGEAKHWGVADIRFRYVRGKPSPWGLRPDGPGDLINTRLGGFQILLNHDEGNHGWSSEQQLLLPLCLFLIFALPPFLWWRKWRKTSGRGFPVETKEGLTAETQRTQSDS